MLAVPPLIPSIHHALNLDEKSVGALVSGPVLVLAIASVPGSLLIAKLGVRGALLVGLGSVAVFGALRGYGPSIPVLFSATFLMGVGVALSQPAFPSLVREWFPRRIAIATAVYANGILIGETLPTVFTTPVGVLPLAHGDWRWAIASWSALVLLSAIAIGAAAPARTAGSAARPLWWPDWRQAAAIFTLQYATAFVIPLLAGALWDATGQAALAFTPGIFAAAAMAWGAMALRIPDRVQASG